VLPRTGPAPSFEALVRAVTQDVHPFTVLQELIRLGAASVEVEGEREMVVPARRDFVAAAGSREALELLAASLADHTAAAVSNLLGAEPTLEQSVFAAGITADSAQRLHALARALWARARNEIIEEATRLYEAFRPEVALRVMERLTKSKGFPDVLSRLRTGDPVALRITENPAGIAEAEEAALALEEAIGAAPRVATPDRLDAIGAATLRLERVLGGEGSPFAVAMKQATATVEELTRDVEAAYKVPLD